MKVLIFSSADHIIEASEALGRSRTWELEVHDAGGLSAGIKTANPSDFLYADVSGLDDPDRKKLFKTLSRKDTLHWGILDPEGIMTDPAEVFFSGGRDYVGPQLYQAGLTAARMKKVWEYAFSCGEEPEELAPITRPGYKIAPGGWAGVKPGQEYTFSMLLVQVDQVEQLKRLVGEGRLTKLREDIKAMLAQHMGEAGGQVWMFMDMTALVIFPFDGKTCPAFLNSIQFLLNKNIYCYEKLRTELPMTFRLALHMGNVEYQLPGKTGTIVSDAVNSVFHLGQKYAKDNGFYLTEDALPYLPEEFKDLFKPDGTYEGRQIWRMKRLI